MLKRVLLAASVLAAAPATAGDAYNWTGLHAGINAGYGAGQFRLPLSADINSPPNTYSLSGKLGIDGNGFVGGAQIGYDYLFPDRWLIGFETDAQGTTISPDLSASGPLESSGSYAINLGAKLDFVGTARARVGYVLPENVLVYGTGGLAYGGVGITAALHVQSASNHADLTLERYGVDVGWTIGAGVEYPVTDKLSLRAEYLYVDLGSHTVLAGQFTAPNLSGSGTVTVVTNAHIGRIALNYAL
jgi:outer membrane immunogenic protein